MGAAFGSPFLLEVRADRQSIPLLSPRNGYAVVARGAASWPRLEGSGHKRPWAILRDAARRARLLRMRAGVCLEPAFAKQVLRRPCLSLDSPWYCRPGDSG